MKLTQEQAATMKAALLERIPWSEGPVLRAIDHGIGWLPITAFLIDLAVLYGIRVAQVKEKFGGLRFYYDPCFDEAGVVFAAAVDAAELLAARTCEDCGEDGYTSEPLVDVLPVRYQTMPKARLRAGAGRWWQTLCDACEENKHGHT